MFDTLDIDIASQQPHIHWTLAQERSWCRPALKIRFDFIGRTTPLVSKWSTRPITELRFQRPDAFVIQAVPPSHWSLREMVPGTSIGFFLKWFPLTRVLLNRDFLSSPRGSVADPNGGTNLELVRGKFGGSVQTETSFPLLFHATWNKLSSRLSVNLCVPPFFYPFQLSGWRSNKL